MKLVSVALFSLAAAQHYYSPEDYDHMMMHKQQAVQHYINPYADAAL